MSETPPDNGKGRWQKTVLENQAHLKEYVRLQTVSMVTALGRTLQESGKEKWQILKPSQEDMRDSDSDICLWWNLGF